MIECKTTSGYECQIDEHVIEDWEFLELLAEAQENNVLASVAVLKKLLSKEDYSRLKDHCRIEGKVSTERMFQELQEILETNTETKN